METIRKTLKATTWKGFFFFFWGGDSQKSPNRTPLYTDVGFKKILKPSRAMNGILPYINRGHITATPAQFKKPRSVRVSQARLIPWTLRGHQPRTVYRQYIHYPRTDFFPRSVFQNRSRSAQKQKLIRIFWVLFFTFTVTCTAMKWT